MLYVPYLNQISALLLLVINRKGLFINNKVENGKHWTINRRKSEKKSGQNTYSVDKNGK
jgi:hypothetical protein